jgi:hypothetical protein
MHVMQQQKAKDVCYSTAFARAMAAHQHAKEDSREKVEVAKAAAEQAEQRR